MYFTIILIIPAGLGLIPAIIAENKGYSFGLWWLYGWLLFIVAIIHVSLIPDKNSQQSSLTPEPSVSDELKKHADILIAYKELLDTGVITQEEYDSKKKQILALGGGRDHAIPKQESATIEAEDLPPL